MTPLGNQVDNKFLLNQVCTPNKHDPVFIKLKRRWKKRKSFMTCRSLVSGHQVKGFHSVDDFFRGGGKNTGVKGG